jgi:hypothetical protein
VVVLLFHSVLRFIHLELFLVRILILCVPVVGVLSFFSGTSSSILQRGVCWICSLCRVLLVLQITSFFSSLMELELLLWCGCGGAPVVTEWSTRSLCTVGDRPSGTSRVAGCHSVEDLGFQLLDRRDMTLLQRGAVWSAGILCTLGKKAFGAACRIASYSFPPLTWESCVLALLDEQNSKTWSLGFT